MKRRITNTDLVAIIRERLAADILERCRPMPCPTCGHLCMPEWCAPLTLNVGFRCEQWPHFGGNRKCFWQMRTDGSTLIGWSKS